MARDDGGGDAADGHAAGGLLVDSLADGTQIVFRLPASGAGWAADAARPDGLEQPGMGATLH